MRRDERKVILLEACFFFYFSVERINRCFIEFDVAGWREPELQLVMKQHQCFVVMDNDSTNREIELIV
ncbi:hypothetical protein D3C86_2075180 [compost metagenome]